MIRAKPFLTYLVLSAIPLLLLAGLNFWNGVKTVNATLNTVVQNDLNSFNVAIDEVLREKERAVRRLAMSEGVRRLAVAHNETGDSEVGSQNSSSVLTALPDLGERFQNLTIFAANHQPILTRTESMDWTTPKSVAAGDIPRPDQRVWGLQGNILLDNANDAKLEYTAPIHDENGTGNVGALVGVLDLESIFADAAHGLETKSGGQPSLVVVLDDSGKAVYHSDRQLKLRPATEVVPGISAAMLANEAGLGQFRAATGTYQAAYSPIPRLHVAVAVARNRASLFSDAYRWGITGLIVAIAGALAAAFILDRHVQRRSRGMAQVTEDLSAIAKGELDRRIILRSSDDARGIADNINVVTERLRAQIAREEESRQFESFVRLSAMLTHDLKNAIEGLSLTVGNMERHFDNPQFRADAMKGLTSATDKLKALVARLSRPLTSLSGEHKRPTKVDLVPIIQRVVAMTAEPLRGKHKIVLRLPQALFALADAARVEEVIENLVLNALEAMSEVGGMLTIEAGQTSSGAPTFSISDTGRGMSRTFIETRLFRPFSTTKKTGIGLGLYTCREVIIASAGTIEVESVEGAGTTFRVVLPSIPHDRRN